MKHLPRYGLSAGDRVEGEFAEQLYRHYAGIPGWRSRDRNVLAAYNHVRAPAGPTPSSDVGIHEGDERSVESANARAAAHEEKQIRAADDAAIRDAREGRMP